MSFDFSETKRTCSLRLQWVRCRRGFWSLARTSRTSVPIPGQRSTCSMNGARNHLSGGGGTCQDSGGTKLCFNKAAWKHARLQNAAGRIPPTNLFPSWVPSCLPLPSSSHSTPIHSPLVPETSPTYRTVPLSSPERLLSVFEAASALEIVTTLCPMLNDDMVASWSLAWFCV